MSTLQPTSPSDLSRNPFEVARSHLIRRLLEVVVAKPVRVFPGPSGFQAVRQMIRDVAEIHDEWLRAIGDQIEDNSPYSIDSTDFDGAALAGVDNALFACDQIAERMIEDRSAA